MVVIGAENYSTTYYLRARYYDPAIGRFTQQDSLLFTTRKLASGFEYVDPLSLNLYTYCYGNPVRYADPSGNVPVDTVLDFVSLGFSILEFLAAPSIATLGSVAWDTAALLLPYVPGSYIDDVAKASAKLISNADNYTKAGSWALKPFDRGWTIEKILDGLCTNFKTIDNFTVIVDGRSKIISDIMSIKSINLSAKSYQKAGRLRNLLKKYIDDLVRFSGAPYRSVFYEVAENSARTLHIAVPPMKISSMQAEVIGEMIEYAKTKGVTLIISIVE